MGHAAAIDDYQVGILGRLDLFKAEAFEQLPNLLAFVLIYFAAKSIDRKSCHNMIQ